jgi:purine-binding chemotaxis protein CheW
MIPVLTFQLGSETFAVSIDDVLEVAAMVQLTPLPEAPPEVLGVVNRHGEVMTIVDLRRVLGQADPMPITIQSLFIVFQVNGKRLGGVVDAVLGVSYIDPAAAKITPSATWIRGIMKQDDDLFKVFVAEKLIDTYH